MEAVRPYTMLEPDRLEKLFVLSEQIPREAVPGDLVECGVCNGGTAALLAAAVQPGII